VRRGQTLMPATPAPDDLSYPSSGTTGSPANDDRKPAIVTVKRRRSRFGDVPDMAPEEHRLRGEGVSSRPVRRIVLLDG
jgi:hypothetical protein